MESADTPTPLPNLSAYNGTTWRLARVTEPSHTTADGDDGITIVVCDRIPQLGICITV